MHSWRGTCLGTLLGMSKGARTERDMGRTLACTESWREPPDHASVNLTELGTLAVMERL